MRHRTRVKRWHDPRMSMDQLLDRIMAKFTPATPIRVVVPSSDKASAKRYARVEKARAKVQGIRDRRRFKTAPVPTGEVRVVVSEDTSGTIFPKTVLEWSPEIDEEIFKDGANNSKIGGDVLVGRLRGAKIFTLALEERATCPRSCHMWTKCMGNACHLTRRWKDTPALREAIARDLDAMCAQHEKVLIRLHVLGDFVDGAYLGLWEDALDRNDNLNVFGFTAHRPDSDMGRAIAMVRGDFGMRFAIRHSGTEGQWGCTTIDHPTEAPHIDRGSSRGIVCPEQRSAMGDIRDEVHCGSCGICWKSQSEIVFIEH